VIEDIQGAQPGLRLAGLIEERRRDILEEYEAALRAGGNATVQGEVSLEQLVGNGDQILMDVIESLRAGTVLVRDTYQLFAWDIGWTRAADGVHPSESLQASSVFFRIVMGTAAELQLATAGDFGLLTIVAMSLERSIMARVRTLVAGYTSFLLNQVREAQVSERQRIARDLHDRIGHCISVAHRQLELYNMYQATDPAKAFQKVETAQRAVRESMENLRAVTSTLYSPEPLKSLETALLNYLEAAAAEGLEVRVRVNGDDSWAPVEVLDEVFLVLREAARNTLKHAEASILIINVDITPNEIRAFVEDDGRGFDPDEPPAFGGLGVFSMRERAGLLGGMLSVRSRPGGGTRINLAVPFPEKGEFDDE
jgi:signal transduction histidine kinase